MTETEPQVVRAYRAQLVLALEGIPNTVAQDILRGVDEELEGLETAEAARRIETLGDPAFIAAEARAELFTDVAASPPTTEPSNVSGYNISAVLLVALGGVVIPVVGWIAGIAMVALSSSWRGWEKWVAALSPLAAGAASVLLSFLSSRTGGSAANESNPFIPTHFDLIWLIGPGWAVVNIVVGIWLLFRLKRPTRVAN
jgi:uncharacterized membrane protein